jgi:hypothetical protein
MKKMNPSIKHADALILFSYGNKAMTTILEIKYHSMTDAAEALGGVDEIIKLFFLFPTPLV